jgi:hypothetical protein
MYVMSMTVTRMTGIDQPLIPTYVMPKNWPFALITKKAIE